MEEGGGCTGRSKMESCDGKNREVRGGVITCYHTYMYFSIII